MKIVSAIKIVVFSLMLCGMVACDEEAPPQDPNKQQRNTYSSGATNRCYNKARNACVSPCYWQERARQCSTYQEQELTCDQRDQTTCQQTTSGSTAQCNWLPGSNVCITVGDTDCIKRRSEADCRGVTNAQCTWIGSACTQFTQCEQIPAANCNGVNNCRRVQGGGTDLCTDPMKATEYERQIQAQRNSGNNVSTMILAAALPGAITLVGRLFGLQSGNQAPMNNNWNNGVGTGGTVRTVDTMGTFQRGVPTINDGTAPDLSQGANLDDYTQAPLLASAQQASTGRSSWGAGFAQCQNQSAETCDRNYPTCAWVQNSCVSAQSLTSYQICRSVAVGTSGSVGQGEIFSEDARRRCGLYSQHCRLTTYSCDALQP
jgi:hypothetical protein